jgi:Secretion system C-terminal sorting domain
MKIKFFFICTMAAVLTAQSLTAHPLFIEDNKNIEVVAVNKTLRINVAKMAGETVTIRIENAFLGEIFSETFTKSALIRQYDLRQFENGEYRLIIENERTKTIQPFSVEYSRININEMERSVGQLPQIKKAKNGFDVRAYLLSKAEISVVITDNQGISVFKETNNALALAKHYNLSNLPKGVYFIEIKANGDVKNETITID